MTFIDPTAIRNTPDQIISQFDPFVGTTQSTSRTRAYCRIWLGSYDVEAGYEVTDKIFPHLISVHIDDSLDHATADIELDDRYGSLPIPPLHSPCVIYLGWQGSSAQECFAGAIQDIEHGCQRSQGGGRRLWIHAKGENFNSPGKENQQGHMGEGAGPGESEGSGKIPLPEAVKNFAGKAMHTAICNPKLDSIKRDYWSIDNESYLNWSSRISDELGLLFRVVRGTQSEWTTPDQRADGDVQVIQAVYNDNLIGWRLHPAAARPAWNESKQQFYDTRSAQWKGITSAIAGALPGASSVAGYSPAGPASSSGVAQQQADGTGDMVSMTPAPGRVVIIGEPSAHAGYYCNIVGARPGVDGIWFMKEVEHLYSRQGYITWCDVWYPMSISATVQRQINGQLAAQGLPSYEEIQASVTKEFTVDAAAMAKLVPDFQNLTPQQQSTLQNIIQQQNVAGTVIAP